MTHSLMCPHRRYVREAQSYVCLYCGEPLPLGEPETEPVETWAATAHSRPANVQRDSRVGSATLWT